MKLAPELVLSRKEYKRELRGVIPPRKVFTHVVGTDVIRDADGTYFVADVDGVRDSQGEVVSSLSTEAAHELVANGIASDGMAAKLEAAETALVSGVARVRICGLAGFDNEEHGTFLTQSQSAAL